MSDTPPTPVPDGGVATDLRGTRILLVEDSLVNQRLVGAMLARLGLEVATADDGEPAVTMFRNDPPQLVLMDVNLPTMDGLQATRHIRQFEDERGGVRVPIIALTATTETADRESCLAAGMDDLLAKPFTFGELTEILARWLPHAPH
jgi:two-component system, sensor histidine kinase